MTQAELKALGIEDEAAKKVEAAYKEALKAYVPKTRFDEVNGRMQTAEATVAERDKQLETLKASTGDVEGLKKQIEQLQTENKTAAETHAAEVKTLKINAAVEAALTADKAKNSKAVRALLDLEKAEFDENGSIKGLADQIKKLKSADDSKFLFDTETNKKPAVKGASPADSGKEEADDGVDVSKMSYEQLAAWYDANPNAKI